MLNTNGTKKHIILFLIQVTSMKINSKKNKKTMSNYMNLRNKIKLDQAIFDIKYFLEVK